VRLTFVADRGFDALVLVDADVAAVFDVDAVPLRGSDPEPLVLDHY
jgi:hypothetical protein